MGVKYHFFDEYKSTLEVHLMMRREGAIIPRRGTIKIKREQLS
jgi:hypothetical protein